MYVDQSYSLKRNFFLEFHWLFEKFKEIITNVAFFGNFVLKFLPSQKKNNKENKTCPYREYLLCLQPNANGSFFQKCINFVEQQLKFCHFYGSITPLLIAFNTTFLAYLLKKNVFEWNLKPLHGKPTSSWSHTVRILDFFILIFL